MRPRTSAAFLATAALLLSACGGADEDGGGGGGEEIKVGVIASLSGPASVIGTNQLTGVEMAVEELNADGGVDGRQLTVLQKDDEGDPTTASQVARELLQQEEVDLLWGPTLSSPSLSVAPLATQTDTVEFGTGVAPDLGNAEEFPYFFRMSPSAALQAETFVQFMEDAGLTRAGLLAVNNELGTSNVDAFTAQAGDAGIEVADTQFHETGATDLTPQVEALERAGAEVLIMLNTAPPDGVATISARNTLSWDVPIIGFSATADPAIVDAFEPEELDQVYAGQTYRQLTTPDTPQVTLDWLDRLREYLGVDALETDASQTAVGYDAVMMWAAAVEETGSTEAADIASYLEENVYEGVVSRYTYDAERHEGVTLEDIVFVEAASLDDGLRTVADTTG